MAVVMSDTVYIPTEKPDDIHRVDAEKYALQFGNDPDENKYPSDHDENYNQYIDGRFKIVVGIDFGTDGSELAYAIPDKHGTPAVYIHNIWRDVAATQKPITSVVFDNTGQVQGGGTVNPEYVQIIVNQGWKV
eukprot:28487_1